MPAATEPKTNETLPEQQLIARLYRTVSKEGDNQATSEDRAVLAKLRRGLGKQFGEVGAAERDAIVCRCFDGDVHHSRIESACLVASLFAMHPQIEKGSNFGDSMRRLYDERDEADGVERRFTLVLNSNRDEIASRLRQAVALLKQADVPVNYSRLLDDLNRWTHPDRFVQRKWSRAFWRQKPKERGDD